VASVRHPAAEAIRCLSHLRDGLFLACVVLFVVLGWVLSGLGLERWLGPWGIGSILLIFGVLPALVIATWQARQPPMDRGRPD
jgi:hypothetical protein